MTTKRKPSQYWRWWQSYNARHETPLTFAQWWHQEGKWDAARLRRVAMRRIAKSHP